MLLKNRSMIAADPKIYEALEYIVVKKQVLIFRQVHMLCGLVSVRRDWFKIV